MKNNSCLKAVVIAMLAMAGSLSPSSAAEAGQDCARYIVSTGDTGVKIAHKTGLTAAQLLQMNPTVNFAQLKVGQHIRTTSFELKPAQYKYLKNYFEDPSKANYAKVVEVYIKLGLIPADAPPITQEYAVSICKSILGAYKIDDSISEATKSSNNDISVDYSDVPSVSAAEAVPTVAAAPTSVKIYSHVNPYARGELQFDFSESTLTDYEKESFLFWKTVSADGAKLTEAIPLAAKINSLQPPEGGVSPLASVFQKFAKINSNDLIQFSENAKHHEKQAAAENIKRLLPEAKREIDKLKATDYESYYYLSSDCALMYVRHGYLRQGQDILQALDLESQGVSKIKSKLSTSAYERIMLDRVEFSAFATKADFDLFRQRPAAVVANKNILVVRLLAMKSLIEYCDRTFTASGPNRDSLNAYIKGHEMMVSGLEKLVSRIKRDDAIFSILTVGVEVFTTVVDGVTADMINNMRYEWEAPAVSDGGRAGRIIAEAVRPTLIANQKKDPSERDYRIVYVW